MLKRKLAALLAGAMVLTSLPMVSFARTDNNITYVPTVKKDDTEFKLADAPKLIIEERDVDLEGSVFRLTFDGAEWKGGEVTGDAVYKKLSKTIVEIALPTTPNVSKKI